MTFTLPPTDEAPPSTRPTRLGEHRAQYALLITVLVLATVLAGNLIFYPLLGEQYGKVLKACVGAIPDLTSLDASEQLSVCSASAERVRVSFSLGFGVAALLLGFVLLRWLPTRLYRRVGRVRTAGQRWQDAAAKAVRSMGGHGEPQVEFASRCREAFTVRVKGQVRIVLPYGVMALPADQANALLRHECAHVVAGDVGRVWANRALWWATPVILVLPLLVDVGRGLLLSDKTIGDTLLSGFNGDYLIRSTLALGLAWFVSRNLLRSREHEADLLSTDDTADAESLRVLLTRVHTARVSRLRGLLALHPSQSRRVEIIQRGASHPHAVEGFTFGVLAGIVQPTLAFFTWPLMSSVSNLQVSVLAAAVVPGTLLGLIRGATIWQTEVNDSPRPWQDRLIDVAGLPLGVAVGLPLAMVGVGRPWVDGNTLWVWGFTAAALAGASTLCAGIASLWVRHRSIAATPRWLTPLAVVLFIAAVCAIEMFTNMVQGVEWYLALGALAFQASWVLLAAQLALVAVVWRISNGARLRLVALAVIIAVPVVVVRLWFAQPITQGNAFDEIVIDCLIAAGAGLLCFLVCAAIYGRPGVALGLAGAWTTALLVALASTLKFKHPSEIVTTYLTNFSDVLGPSLLLLAAFVITSSRRSKVEYVT